MYKTWGAEVGGNNTHTHTKTDQSAVFTASIAINQSTHRIRKPERTRVSGADVANRTTKTAVEHSRAFVLHARQKVLGVCVSSFTLKFKAKWSLMKFMLIIIKSEIIVKKLKCYFIIKIDLKKI